MAVLTPEQRRTRARVETVIRLMAPLLDIVLAAGERLSRLVEPEDHDYYPPHTGEVGPPPQAAASPRASED